MSRHNHIDHPNHRRPLLGGAILPWLELTAVALTAPALWFPTVRASLTVLAILLLLLAWLAVALVEGTLWPRSALDWPLVVILLGAILGAWTSPAPQLTLPKVTGLLLGLAAYRAILRCARGVPIHAPHAASPSRTPELQSRSSVRSGPALGIVCGLLLLATAFAVVGLAGGLRANKLPRLSPAMARIPRYLGALPGTQDGLISTNQLGGDPALRSSACRCRCWWQAGPHVRAGLGEVPRVRDAYPPLPALGKRPKVRAPFLLLPSPPLERQPRKRDFFPPLP